jgi:pimeloyl-ACP methyl ester carboxylesterase
MRLYSRTGIFAVIVLLLFAPAAFAVDRPLVFIPGILGSKLCERQSGNVIWGTRASLQNFKQLALPVTYDPAKLEHVSCGIIEDVQILGPWRFHQYDNLFETLRGFGYALNGDLFVFHYDWRLSNRVNAVEFDKFVKKNVPSGQFDIVAHSMGGIIAKLWLSQSQADHRVRALVTLGTPFLGSASTFKTLDDGWGFWANLLAHGLDSVRATTLTFPSVYELLPTYKNCCGFETTSNTAPIFFDPFDPKIWNTFKWLPASMKTPERLTWLTQTLATAKEISSVSIPPTTRVTTVVTGLIDTTWRVIFNQTDGKVVSYISRPGDGTVYQLSAANGQLDNARPALTEHQRIFENDAARQVLRWVLVSGPEPNAVILQDIKARLKTASGKEIGLSDVRVEILPVVSGPNENAEVFVELKGEKDLTEADLSNITTTLDQTRQSLTLSKRELIVDPADAGIVRLFFAFNSPTDIGPYSATVHLPGVAELSDIAVVVQP